MSRGLAVTAALFLAMLGTAAPADAQAPPLGKPAIIDKTFSGQPIRAPSGDLRVTVTQVTLPAGGRLPPHKHPYPRVVNVLEGRLKVINLDTGETREAAAGDWLVDAVEQWHEVVVLGDQPVRMLTIDQAPPGTAPTVLRAP